MTGFEPRTSGIESDRSTNWATTTSQFSFFFVSNILYLALVVMVGDSCPECRGFESQHHILDGHFSPLICSKIVLIFVWKWPKNNWKEGQEWPILIFCISFFLKLSLSLQVLRFFKFHLFHCLNHFCSFSVQCIFSFLRIWYLKFSNYSFLSFSFYLTDIFSAKLRPYLFLHIKFRLLRF